MFLTNNGFQMRCEERDESQFVSSVPCRYMDTCTLSSIITYLDDATRLGAPYASFMFGAPNTKQAHPHRFFVYSLYCAQICQRVPGSSRTTRCRRLPSSMVCALLVAAESHCVPGRQELLPWKICFSSAESSNRKELENTFLYRILKTLNSSLLLTTLSIR